MNRVRIHLQLLLVSNLLVYKKNTIKCSLIHGLVNKSYISILIRHSQFCVKRISITGKDLFPILVEVIVPYLVV